MNVIAKYQLFSGVQEVQRPQNQLFRWKIAVSTKVRCLVRAEGLKAAIQMKNRCFYHSQVFSKCKGLEISYFGWKTAVSIKIRCLGSAEGSKSAIQMENNRLYQNQVFRKSRDFKISYRYFRWKTAFYIKIWCLGSADGSKSAINFRRKPAISIKVRCLVSAKGSKSAIRLENSCLYQNQVFRKCRGLEISYLDENSHLYHLLHVNYSH